MLNDSIGDMDLERSPQEPLLAFWLMSISKTQSVGLLSLLMLGGSHGLVRSRGGFHISVSD